MGGGVECEVETANVRLRAERVEQGRRGVLSPRNRSGSGNRNHCYCTPNNVSPPAVLPPLRVRDHTKYQMHIHTGHGVAGRYYSTAAKINDASIWYGVLTAAPNAGSLIDYVICWLATLSMATCVYHRMFVLVMSSLDMTHSLSKSCCEEPLG